MWHCPTAQDHLACYCPTGQGNGHPSWRPREEHHHRASPAEEAWSLWEGAQCTGKQGGRINCVYGQRNTFILHVSSDPLQVRELSNESLHLSASYPGANAQVGLQSMTWHFYFCLTPFFIASFPGPTQLSIACSFVHARGEPGNEAISSCTPGLLTSWVVNISGTKHVLISTWNTCE